MPRAAAPAGTQNTGPALLGGVHHEKRENRDCVIEVPQEPGAGLELDWQQARNTASVGNRWRKTERHTGNSRISRLLTPRMVKGRPATTENQVIR
jgi:hypothetical protein